MRIEIVPYDRAWPDRFEREKTLIAASLGAVVVQIYHIGSTAVPGLGAKPIIDIILAVSSLPELDACGQQMEAFGYEGLGEFGIQGRRYFRKGGDARSHQVHAFASGDANIARHLAFRDYLRSHPGIRAEYGALKVRVAADCEQDIERYCDGKNDFIKFHEAKALNQ